MKGNAPIALNCDLGESYYDDIVGCDELLMPWLDQANIACGFHGGDPLTLKRTLVLARKHGVSIGAHPSYPDREGFGRRSLPMSGEGLIACLHYQLAALEGMAACVGVSVDYVKPHGALYNDMMADAALRETVLLALRDYHRPLPLMLQSTADWQTHEAQATKHGIPLLFEVFADRGYRIDGSLTPRSEAGAVLDAEQIVKQCEHLLRNGSILSVEGKELTLRCDTLCIHGDNPAAPAVIKDIHTMLQYA